MRRHATYPLALVVLSAAGAAQAINFHRTDHETALAPEDSAAGDFDGDGVLDLAAVGGSLARVAVLLGTGGGNFAPFQLVAGLGAGPVSVVAGDFDGDALDDLAVACRDSDQVWILDGVAGSLPAIASAHSVGGRPRWIVAADFDQDGDLDLATPNTGSVDVSLLFGDGLGGFGAPSFHPAAASPWMLTTADLHADGDVDLVGAGDSNYLAIYHGDGAGAFTSTTSSSPGAKWWVAVGDMNGDLLPDAFAREWSGLDDDVSRLKGNALGTFDYQSWTGPSINTGELVDVTGDGKLDWLTTGTFPTPAKLGVQPGTGTLFGFGAMQSFPLAFGGSVTTTKLRIATADLDANGQLDVIVSHGANSLSFTKLSVYLQVPPAPPSIASVTPTALPLMGGVTLAVTGSGFTSLKSVVLGTMTIWAGGAGTVLDATGGDGAFSIQIGAGPLPVPPGPTTLTVTNSFGSASSTIDVFAPDPPVLVLAGPTFLTTIKPILVAAPGSIAYLAASNKLLPSSIPGLVDLGIGSGFSALVFLGAVAIPPAGWAQKTVSTLGVPPGTPIHFQFARLDPLAPTFPLAVSNVISGTKQ